MAELIITEVASTSTPSAGTGAIYIKTDGKAYSKDDAGNEYDLTAGAGGGEANTASNQGVGGIGIFIQKTSVDLEFKNLNEGNGITLTDDVGNNEIDIAVNEAEIDHDSLLNYVANEHIDWTNASANLTTTGDIDADELVIRIIRRDTSDGADNLGLALTGGGAVLSSRGSYFELYGNEHVSEAGNALLTLGNVAGAAFEIRKEGSTSPSLIFDANGLQLIDESITITPNTDTDIDLIGVGVTGLPIMSWDESEDAFAFTHSIEIAGDPVVTEAGAQTLTNKTITSPSGLVKGDVGLGNVDNTSDATKNSATATLTNKRITKRTSTEVSSATPTINTDNVDLHTITALATDITSMTTNLSGTPVQGDVLQVWITDSGSGQTIAWGASFDDGAVALPTSVGVSAVLRVLLMYDGSIWRCMAADEDA